MLEDAFAIFCYRTDISVRLFLLVVVAWMEDFMKVLPDLHVFFRGSYPSSFVQMLDVILYLIFFDNISDLKWLTLFYLYRDAALELLYCFQAKAKVLTF